MLKDHVIVDMENLASATKDDKNYVYDNHVNSYNSLKKFYLGCSCSVCYQRYEFSKGSHLCNSKTRCHVKQGKITQRLDPDQFHDTVDDESTSVEPPILLEYQQDLRSQVYTT